MSHFHVFTFKEGLLSAVAHDLRFSLEGVEISIDGAQVKASFTPDDLKGDGVMRDGVLDPNGLSAKDWKDIDKNIRKKILDTKRFPQIHFEGQREGGEVVGALRMKGREVKLRFPVSEEGGALSGRVEIKPSDWGIPPFKALLGAIKLQDRVIIDFKLPRP